MPLIFIRILIPVWNKDELDYKFTVHNPKYTSLGVKQTAWYLDRR